MLGAFPLTRISEPLLYQRLQGEAGEGQCSRAFFVLSDVRVRCNVDQVLFDRGFYEVYY